MRGIMTGVLGRHVRSSAVDYSGNNNGKSLTVCGIMMGVPGLHMHSSAVDDSDNNDGSSWNNVIMSGVQGATHVQRCSG